MPPEVTTHAPTAVALADYTRPELIVPRLREHDAAGIIGELSQVLQRHGDVPDVLPFYQAALNQELLSGSALDCGIAFPHGRLTGIKRPQFALGRTSEPVVWGASNAGRVQLIFLMAVPATDATSYLQVLSSLARLGQNREWLAELLVASGTDAMLTVLERIKLRPG